MGSGSGLRFRKRAFLLAAVPLVLAALAITLVFTQQARTLAEKEIDSLQAQLIAAKKAELHNYISIARTAIGSVYGNAQPDDLNAKRKVMQLLAAMLYGQDGYFFVFDYEGTNLVAPRQTHLITRNWAGLTDSQGTPITDKFIELARSGGGHHQHLWRKPTTGQEAEMISYVIGLQDWQWAVGTGIFIDDIQTRVAAARADVDVRVRRTFAIAGVVSALALTLVFLSGIWLNFTERSLAETRQRRLNQRIIDTQEEERGRVARELHDSISQILVGVRYSLELARRRFASRDEKADESLEKGISGLTSAISEVRRISRDLRPGVLDDLGLGPALQTLAEDFSQRTGIQMEFETVVFRNRLDKEAKIALYRIAQEALTNIERHSGARAVRIDLHGHRKGATLIIADNGQGIAASKNPALPTSGLGLRNMQERMEQLGGILVVTSSSKGTTIEATAPLSHMLPPERRVRKAEA
jgi:two-component system NarL family sensor kinase